MKYSIISNCKNCNHQSEIKITKQQAAFDLVDTNQIWKTPCEKCNSIEKKILSINKPTIDQELMEMWIINKDFYFLEQDEDLYIAVMDNLEMILSYLDRDNILPSKQLVLLESLCVLLYDNLVDESDPEDKNDPNKKENLKILLPVISKHKALINSHKHHIYDYVIDEIEPYLK